MIQIDIPENPIEMEPITNHLLFKNHLSGGLYFLYGEHKELLYIGLAKNVITRIGQHIGNARTNPFKEIKENFFYFSAFACDCPVERDIYETYLINLLQPPYNLSKTFTYESNRPLSQKEIAYEELMNKQIEESLKQFSL